ncbi:RNA polymerase sigma-70 factor (ECF subfamily) [Actinocorallia herbida]|uniref:RNA polymerase sigma-70 factor (ECF subfamily) n=1 Tax=Actinocorallia herbida TaxID=58109 RepID=A0A3N1CUD8_9ACTN|nr:RNA polymerase sigma factor SigJ [Actinocorallia herbida]ROO84920.1 RNA polymerase sigma-70 factor (ECF subfamily) [Actinocorallia herbida]
MDGFEAQRPRLMGLAYRMLGRVADAEDVVQEAWLRWAQADRANVADPEAFLVRTTTRLAIDRLRRVRARREVYPGEWLPEPILTATDDAADQVVRTESVTMAVLVVLERLSPLERAVFVLREVFEEPYPAIAEALGKAEPAVRQLAARARAHVRDGRPRYEVDRERWGAAAGQFFHACATGDMDALLATLSPDVSLTGDGGGRTPNALRVVRGPAKAARLLMGIFHGPAMRHFLARLGLADAEPGILFADANGRPAAVLTMDGRPVGFLQPTIVDGLVHDVYVITNPAKMAGLMSQEEGPLRP